MATTVVNLRDERFDVYIGRPDTYDGSANYNHNWGNPFRIGHKTREEVIDLFEDWFLFSGDARAMWMRMNIDRLRGKRLGCFCKPKACHGDVLAKAADAASREV